jgi:hypothetical protein
MITTRELLHGMKMSFSCGLCQDERYQVVLVECSDYGGAANTGCEIALRFAVKTRRRTTRKSSSDRI